MTLRILCTIRIITQMAEATTGGSNSNIEEVHFYPGGKVLVFFVDGKIKLMADAWGGPPQKLSREAGGGMAQEPTHPGAFVIDRIEAYHTETWFWSKIPWGTPIRPSRITAGKVEYLASPGKWRPLQIRGRWVDAKMIKDRYGYLYHTTANHFPDTWIFNDFGPSAVRYYEDRNRNSRRDANEPLKGEMIHTTPENEAETRMWNEDRNKVRLFISHGCIHIRPAALRVFREAGAFQQGMSLIIHRYDEVFDETKYKRIR